MEANGLPLNLIVWSFGGISDTQKPLLAITHLQFIGSGNRFKLRSRTTARSRLKETGDGDSRTEIFEGHDRQRKSVSVSAVLEASPVSAGHAIRYKRGAWLNRTTRFSGNMPLVALSMRENGGLMSIAVRVNTRLG